MRFAIDFTCYMVALQYEHNCCGISRGSQRGFDLARYCNCKAAFSSEAVAGARARTLVRTCAWLFLRYFSSNVPLLHAFTLHREEVLHTKGQLSAWLH